MKGPKPAAKPSGGAKPAGAANPSGAAKPAAAPSHKPRVPEFYRPLFLATLGALGLASVLGIVESLRHEHRPPSISQEYGPYVRALLQQGDYARASEQLGVAVVLDRTAQKDESMLALGQALARSGKLDAAIAAFQSALVDSPRNPMLHYELANTLAARGEVGAALQEYQATLELNPNFAEARPKLAWAQASVARSRGNFPAAIQAYQTVLELRPDFVDARMELAETLEASGDAAGAIQQLDALARQQPANERNHRALAMALAAQGRHDEAIAAVQRGLQTLPIEPRLQALLQELQQQPH
jgi:tetratricopeptide (TPR) repeat protein